MKYELKELRGTKTVIHCPEEWMANNLLKILDESGVTWCDGDSLKNNCWHEEYDKTCYNLEDSFELYYSDTDTYKDKYKIVEYNDLDIAKTEYTLDQLINNSKLAIHCKEESMAKHLLRALERKGVGWAINIPLSEDTNWEDYKGETCYHIENKYVCNYGTVQYHKINSYTIIEYNDLEIAEEAKEEPALYSSTLENFNGHKWVKFYENPKGTPHIEFKEGCHYKNINGLKEFESNVSKTYGNSDKGLVYRTYMLEADKLRLALELPIRKEHADIEFPNICDLITENVDNITKFLLEGIQFVDGDSDKFDCEYLSKNILWMREALRTRDTKAFAYVERCDGDEYYYDLVTLQYLDNNYAIPVPVLSKLMKVNNYDIYNSFRVKLDEDEIDFI